MLTKPNVYNIIKLWCDDMSKAFRITISIIAGAFLTLALVCVYGFIIGGEENIFYWIFSIGYSFFLTLGLIAFVKGKDNVKSKKHRLSLILITIAIATIMIALYSPLNGFTKSNNHIEYKAEITSVHQYKGEPTRIYFKDQKGTERMVWDLYGGITFDDERSTEEGKIVVIREYEGGFDFPYYDWVDIYEKTK